MTLPVAPLVLLTQPLPRVDAIARDLAGAGFDALSLPFLRLESVPVDAGTLDGLDLVVFVSPGAVDAFRAGHCFAGWPSATAVAAVGKGTLEALDAAGLPPRVVRITPPGDRHDADALLAVLRARPPRDALVVTGEDGRTDWAGALGRLGARARSLVAYRRVPIDPPPDAIARLRESCDGARPLVGVVTLSATAGRLARLGRGLGGAAARRLLHTPMLAIHPRIAAALTAEGFDDVRSLAPGRVALVAALSSGPWAPSPP